MDRSTSALGQSLSLVISTAGIAISCLIIQETGTFARTDSTTKEESKSETDKSSL